MSRLERTPDDSGAAAVVAATAVPLLTHQMRPHRHRHRRSGPTGSARLFPPPSRAIRPLDPPQGIFAVGVGAECKRRMGMVGVVVMEGRLGGGGMGVLLGL